MNNKYFTFDDLNKYDDVIHLFTMKDFDFNSNTVGIDIINNNYRKIENDFNYKFKCIKKSIQVHSNNVKVLTNDNINEEFNDNDGIITNLRGIALVTYVADCQAILLYDPVNKVIGNIHSGWRGTLNSIISVTLNLMKDTFNSKYEDIRVYINPSILKCCFEVDRDVMELFKDKFNYINDFISFRNNNNGEDKYYIDTVKINVEVMKKLGIKKEHIFCSNVCTKCNSDIYHSYRDCKSKKIESGRNIALICLK